MAKLLTVPNYTRRLNLIEAYQATNPEDQAEMYKHAHMLSGWGAKTRAGMVPYYFDHNGNLRMMFMTPTDPSYGGDHPQVAKGAAESGLSLVDNAWKEGNEELGLRKDNTIGEPHKLGVIDYSSVESGYPGPLHVFGVQVRNPDNNDREAWDDFEDIKTAGGQVVETGKTDWMTPEEFQEHGTEGFKGFVKDAAGSIHKKHDLEQVAHQEPSAMKAPDRRTPGYHYRWNGRAWYSKPKFNNGECPPEMDKIDDEHCRWKSDAAKAAFQQRKFKKSYYSFESLARSALTLV